MRSGDEDVALGEPARGESLAYVLHHPGRHHEQVDLHQGHLAAVALEHQRA
jgi:hypothetical protein